MTQETPKDETADVLREAVARIIEPSAWAAYDATLRPFAENRGSREGENFWHPRAYTAGCRTVEDAHKWWLETAENEPVQVYLLRDSLDKASRIAALSDRAAEREGRLTCMTQAAFDRLVAEKAAAIDEATTLRTDHDAMSRRVEALEGALRAVRDDLHNENRLNTLSIADTIWHGPGETTVDFIDAALATTGGAVPEICNCVCHSRAGVLHFLACCGPGSVSGKTPPTTTGGVNPTPPA